MWAGWVWVSREGLVPAGWGKPKHAVMVTIQYKFFVVPCLSQECGLCAQGKAMGHNQGMEVETDPDKAQMK